MSKLYNLKDFNINEKSIFLESKTKKIELLDIALAEEQQVQLKKEFDLLKTTLVA